MITIRTFNPLNRITFSKRPGYSFLQPRLEKSVIGERAVLGQVFEGMCSRDNMFEEQCAREAMCSRDKVFEEISVRGTKCSRYQLTRLIITMFIPQIEPTNTRVSNI